MFKKLYDHFDDYGVDQIPIETDDISDAIVTCLQMQDEIICSPEDLDPKEVKGVFYQYTERDGVYTDPLLKTLIVYSQNVSLEWQRIICAKELVHVCDSKLSKAMSESEVEELLSRLLGKASSEDFGLADFRAAIDRLALYEGLAILFPNSARDHALALLANGQTTYALIANWIGLPIELVIFVLSEKWPDVVKTFLSKPELD